MKGIPFLKCRKLERIPENTRPFVEYYSYKELGKHWSYSALCSYVFEKVPFSV